MPALLDKLKAQIERGLMPSPLGDTIGLRFVSVEKGDVTLDLPVTPKVQNTMHYLHGGAMAALADTTMGFAAISMLEDGETSTTAEFKISFVRPVFEGTVRCRARVLKHGQTLTLIQGEIFDSQDRLAAQVLGTWVTLRGDKAAGRTHKEDITLSE